MVAPAHRVSLWDAGRAPLTLAGPAAGPTEDADARLDVYLPRGGAAKSSSGTAIVIVPGGAYNAPNYRWAKTHEGAHVARWLVNLGILAVVLTYRLPQGRPQVPTIDALQAIETVRQRSEAWAFKALRRVGVMGFSAGGHLAATAATLFTSAANRPDFAMLMYPVITMRSPLAHRLSRRNFLGPLGQADSSLVDAYSAELHVSRTTPPSFIAHARDDEVVRWEHGALFCNASRAHGVPCEYALLGRGGHAFVARPHPWDECKAAAAAWLCSRGLIQQTGQRTTCAP